MLGAIAGAIGGALLGGLLSKGGGSSSSVSYQVPPFAQEGANILLQLLKQTPDISQRIASAMSPYISKASESVESMLDNIEREYREAKGEIGSYYDTAIAQSQQAIERELQKQAVALGVLGLLNTQAWQWTTADIIDKLKLALLREKAQALSKASLLEPEALARAYMSMPSLYSELASLQTQIDPTLIEYGLKQNLAQALMGVPTIAQQTVKKGLLDYLPSVASSLAPYVLKLL